MENNDPSKIIEHFIRIKPQQISVFETICLAILSLFFGFSNAFLSLDKGNSFLSLSSRSVLSYGLIISILFFAICALIIYTITRTHIHKPLVTSTTLKDQKKSDIQYYLIVVGFLLLCWLPVWLAYYPGIFSYDVHGQLPQTIGSFTTHHPLVHTLYLKFFYNIIGSALFHNYNVGIAIATWVQMLIFSCMLSFMHLFLLRAGMVKWFRIVSIVFTGIAPIFSLLAISLTKDVFFSGFICVAITAALFHICLPGCINKKKLGTVYTVSIVGIILTRNNGVYPIIAMVVVLLVFHRTQLKALLLLSACGLIIGCLLLTTLRLSLHAEKGSLNEALSIPYVQISSVYESRKESLTNEEINTITYLIPDVKNYDPSRSDSVKNTAIGDKHKKELLYLYCKLGCKYPACYIKAFLKLNAGYFYIWDQSFAETYNSLNNRQGIYLTDTKKGFGVIHKTHFAKLEELYEYLFSANKYKYILGLNLLCSPAIFFWTVCVLMILICRCNKAKPIVAFVIVLLLTILAGPCALPRYALAFIILIPLLFCTFFLVRKGLVG